MTPTSTKYQDFWRPVDCEFKVCSTPKDMSRPTVLRKVSVNGAVSRGLAATTLDKYLAAEYEEYSNDVTLISSKPSATWLLDDAAKVDKPKETSPAPKSAVDSKRTKKS